MCIFLLQVTDCDPAARTLITPLVPSPKLREKPHQEAVVAGGRRAVGRREGETGLEGGGWRGGERIPCLLK